MEKHKKFRMPSGIRNKLMAAIAMLLVSSIMMVSSTYAWFTLSTAPEVTGITTSVGANGNLEMALLTTETYGNMDAISSAVGSSSAAAAVTVANVTWGNLVDLSDASYGLQNINLQPARLNFAENDSTVLASLTGPLMTPTYGKDGRVAAVDRATYSAIMDAQGAWTFVTGSQTYGVRAIGSNDNLTPQQAGLMAAKAAYGNNLNSAKSTIQASLSTNGNALAGAITSLAMGTNEPLTNEQQTAINSMVNAADTALGYIDSAYKQVLLAYAANKIGDAVSYSAAVTAINEAASFEAALAELQAKAADFTMPTALTAATEELTEQKEAVADAKQNCTGETPDYNAALTALVNADKVIINGFDASKKDPDENTEDPAALRDSAGNLKQGALSSALINDGGAIVEMPDGSGVFAYVGSVAGNYAANCFVNIVYETINLPNIKATMRTTATVNPALGTAVNGLTPAESTGSENTVLSDLYGYALDFAFRTNAAESYLQLQTEGAQRVYSDSTSLATMGAGSTMTFQTTTNDAGTATLTNDQVKSLMGAIRVAFVGGAGNIYGIASLEDITEGADGFTGKLYMQTYSVNPVTKALEVTGKKVDGANAETDPKEAADTIMKLDQSVAAKLTVIVFLDGDKVDNSDVANAAQSLVGTMNLQFASSAELIPMQNTALQNMTITYTELTDDDYKAGLYEFNNGLYKINTGYKFYRGSDNAVYFSNDDTNYTKLTVMSQNTALSPVTVSVEGKNSIEVGEEATLIAETNVADATIKTVSWNVVDGTAVTVPADDVNTDESVIVTGAEAGTAKIEAVINLEFPVTGGSATTVTKEARVAFNVTVTEPAAPVTYNVTEEVEGLAVSPIANKAGDTVTITAESGYTLSDVVVTGASGTVDVTAVNEGSEYTFTMPAEAVVVNATATANG